MLYCTALKTVGKFLNPDLDHLENITTIRRNCIVLFEVLKVALHKMPKQTQMQDAENKNTQKCIQNTITKCNHLFPSPGFICVKNCHANQSISFVLILLTDRQTDKKIQVMIRLYLHKIWRLAIEVFSFFLFFLNR